MSLKRFRFLPIALVIGGFAIVLVNQSVIAQNAPPTPTPNPTFVALEERVKELESKVKLLEGQKETDKQKLELEIQKQLLPIYVGGIILGAFGLSTAYSLWKAYTIFTEKTKKQLEEDTRKKLDQAFYNADPLYFPLYVPANGFDLEIRRLKKLGFKDLRKYGGLREGILGGIIVVRIPGENFRNNREDQDHAETALQAFEEFVLENKAHEKNVAFVLYITGGQLDKASELVAKYDNVVIANMPVTVAGHVYALVRGLTALEKEQGG
jgi:hypothetical protein